VSEPAPTSQYERMDAALEIVWRGVRGHPAVRPIRDAGRIVQVLGHVEAVWAGAIPDPQQPGKFLITAEIESPTWWDPEATGETQEGKAQRVVEKLARELGRQWADRKE
jgi:hypothetical protein